MGEKMNGLVNLLADKATLKQEVFENTLNTFHEMRDIVFEITEKIKAAEEINLDKVRVEFEHINDYEFQLKVGGDVIVFMMQTNVVALPFDNYQQKSKYIKKDWKRAYFGQIMIYDFIADSLKFNRVDDVGYLIERIFLNLDNHFLVEGLKNIAYQYPDIAKNKVDRKTLEHLVEEAIYVSIETDLISTSYADNFNMTVEQRMVKRGKVAGKKVGFQMSSDG